MGLELLISLPGLLLAIIIHEFSHGFAAYALGDNTAKASGRLSLNPLKHIDLLGFIFLLIFKFGWAKPVPIDPRNFKNRKRDTIIVSLAGPFSNFLLALIISILLSFGSINNYIAVQIMIMALWYNIMLGVFNLLPLPPLDGSKVLASLLPIKYEYKFYKYERYLYVILVIFVATNLVDKILRPIIELVLNLLINIILR